MNTREEAYAIALVEFILYERDRNPEKDWWHLRWWTTVFSYCRWNSLDISIDVLPGSCDEKMSFLSIWNYHVLDWDFSSAEAEFLTKNNFFASSDISTWTFRNGVYPFLETIIDWYQWNFERKVLTRTRYEHFLYYFLLAISYDVKEKYDYYFRFSEMIDSRGLVCLLKSLSLSPNYLFTHIALASYYFHHQDFKKAEKHYSLALSLDENNPYVLARYAMLLCSMWNVPMWIQYMWTVVRLLFWYAMGTFILCWSFK